MHTTPADLTIKDKSDKTFIFPNNAITLGMPVNGKILQAGRVFSWPDGHMATIRRMIREWDEKRQKPVTTQGESPYIPPALGMGLQVEYQPQLATTLPMYQPIPLMTASSGYGGGMSYSRPMTGYSMPIMNYSRPMMTGGFRSFGSGFRGGSRACGPGG